MKHLQDQLLIKPVERELHEVSSHTVLSLVVPSLCSGANIIIRPHTFSRFTGLAGAWFTVRAEQRVRRRIRLSVNYLGQSTSTLGFSGQTIRFFQSENQCRIVF